MADIHDLEAARAAKAAAAAAARQRANGNKTMANLGSAVDALQTAPEWAGALAWNDFSQRPEIIRSDPRALTDHDISAATVWLNQTSHINVSSRITAEAFRFIANQRHFHPVRDYLNGLAWDGVPRLDLWLCDHLGAEDTQLNRAFGARWMIGMVARVMQPGCQFDTALIFESRQGLGKSSALRILGGEWFTDHLPDLTGKDAMQQLQGVWVIEIAELDSFRRAETHRIKSFISARVDRFRPPYGVMPADFPRQCGFGGTVNPGSNGYLRDETGARRFWTVACGADWDAREKAKIADLAAVRDQLWAEAAARYRLGEVWHLDCAELEQAQEEAAAERIEDDPRERTIASFIKGRSFVRMGDILGQDCLCVPMMHWNRALRTEVGFVLSALKWRRKRVRLTDNSLEWLYVPT